jgi:hypothetical protein
MSKKLNVLLGLIGVSILGLFGEKSVKADDSMDETSPMSLTSGIRMCEDLPLENDPADCMVTPEFLQELKERGILETKFSEQSTICRGGV